MVETRLLAGSTSLPSVLARSALPSPEFTGYTPPAAPLVGGRIHQRYPRPKGLRKLARFGVKADVVSAPAALSDVAAAEAIYGTTELRATSALTSTLFSSGTGTVPAIDITKGQVRVWVRCGPNFFANGGAFAVRLYSDGSPTSPSTAYTEASLYFRRGLFASQDASWGRWQCLSVPGPQFLVAPAANNGITNGGGGAGVVTAVTYGSLVVVNPSGAQVAVGDIEYVPNLRTKAALLLSFDDGHASQYWAAEQAARRGIPVTMFVGTPAADIGAANRLTAQQLRNIQDVFGGQIGSQSLKTEQLSDILAMTPDQRTAMFSMLRNWQNSEGLMGGEDGSFFSSVGQSQIDMFRQNFRTLRTFNGANGTGQPALHYGETAPFGDPYAYIAVNGASGRFNVANGYATQMKVLVDQAIVNKGPIPLAWHNELAAGSTQHRQNYLDLLDDVAARPAEIEGLTVREFVDSFA